MASELKKKEDVQDYIVAQMVKYKFRGQPQTFVPRSALDAITEPAVIRHIVKQDPKLILSNEEEEDLVTRIHKHGRRIFAICLHSDKTIKYVKAMLDNKLTDDNLPLGTDGFGSLSEKRGFVHSFMAAQKVFITVDLKEGQFRELIEDLWDRFSIPIHFEDTEANFKGKGAFGEVFQVKIHPDQRSFECWTNEDDMFAMKITNNEPTCESREQKFHLGMAGQEHSHLVKCRASFTLGSKYHMIYDLANCDLESFISEYFDASRPSHLSESWLAQQLAGLAGAINVVHNPKGPQQSMGTLSVPSAHQGWTGYIHDIKPENILVFRKRDGTYLLQLSDFSCARVAEFVATISGKRQSYKTERTTGTPTYRAPESLGNKTSRPYDMWTLGCVYLEILLWFYEGYEALRAFRESREGQVRPNSIVNEAFYHEISSGVVELREPVVKMIHDLQSKCTGDLKDIINTIPQLLQINPDKRPTASELEKRLRHLGTGSTVLKTSPSLNTGHLESLSLKKTALPTLKRDPDSDSESSVSSSVVVVTAPSDG